MRTVIFINYHSRKSRKHADTAISAIENSNKFKVVKIIKVRKISSLQSQLKRLSSTRHIDCVLVGGGDGTIDSAINALNNRKNIVFGFLPLGTGNAFVRSLNMPQSIVDVSNNIGTYKQKSVALGDINGVLFANVASIGIPVRVADTISNRTKRFFGPLAYVLSGFRQLIKHNAITCTVNADKTKHSFSTHHLIIINGNYHGNIQVTSKDIVAENELILVAFGVGQSRLQYARSLLWYALTNKPSKHTKKLSFQSARLKTEPVRDVEVDGEVLSATPATVAVKPQAVKVLSS